jgi:glycosyltransferase involved in cell wall biosynthesis
VRKIALIPVYNEASTLLSVLRPLSGRVDRLVIVDDGSNDGSLPLAEDWARSRSGVEVLRMPDNKGMSAALREGFIHVAAQLHRGQLGPEDILLTLDADGQHDCSEIDALCSYVEEHLLDVALTRRDFSLYPIHKRLGNLWMTLWGSIWSGYRYHDIESGFRAMRLKVLPALLEYYAGRRYSCAQEIAVLTARLGFRVDNRFLTVIRLYRSQTGVRDVLINSGSAILAFARWAMQSKVIKRPPLALPVVISDAR